MTDVATTPLHHEPCRLLPPTTMLPRKALSVAAVLLLTTHPDEGQWLPSQLSDLDWEPLKSRGMLLTRDELWNPTSGGLLNAAVQLGQSCSASFISADGLVITNHHCGDDAIGKLSTLQRNLLRDGFVAAGAAQELPTDLEVFVVRRIEDVTKRVHAVQQRATTPKELYEQTQAEIQRIVEQAERDSQGNRDPRTTCHVAAFYEGREYQLYYRTRITDVRLVYAPPKRTADFGGEIDNWEWPRHSGDFALFRAYVAPDGTPRVHDPENVPYRPDHWLPVTSSGAKANDLVMIVGYPRRTERYLSSVAVENWRSFRYPKQHQLVQQVMTLLERAGKNDPERQLRLSATLSWFANVEKNHRGMVQGLKRNAVLDRKIAEESQFEAWAKAASERQSYLGVLSDLHAMDREELELQEKDVLIRFLQIERVRGLLPLLTTLSTLVRSAKDPVEGEEVRYPESLLEQLGSDAARKDLQEIQIPVLQVVLAEARNLPADQRLAGSEILGDSDVADSEMVAQLLAKSQMLDGKARVALLKGGRRAVETSVDPLVVLVRGIEKEIDEFTKREHDRLGQRLIVGKQWIDAQQAWRGKSFYPDANSTLRISIASVKGYTPRDAVAYAPFSTVSGMLDKDRSEEPFALPEMLREAASRRWISRYRDSQLGDVPVCFLSDADTSNGNSGSPVVNGKGELVGLNFDRVFENVACDFGWHGDRSRSIALDIRFVLWHLEAVMPAPHLLREIGPR